MIDKPHVLFVCTGNAGRSQMAQAMFRQLVGSRVEVESAGVEPWEHLHPMAVRVMAERGVSLNGHYPKPVAAMAGAPFDAVVTIGDPAHRKLPSRLPGNPVWMHWDVSDPADADGTPDSEPVFRRTAERIASRLPHLLQTVDTMVPPQKLAGKVGIGSVVWWSERFQPARHLPVAAGAGFQGIELNLYAGTYHFDAEDAAAIRELREVADDLGMAVWSVHSPDVGSLVTPDEESRLRQLDALRRSLDVAEVLGARVVVSHGLVVGPFEEDLEGCEARLAETLTKLAIEVEPRPLMIAFENTFTGKLGTASRDVLRRVAGLSRAAYGFVLDTGHANIAGDQGEILATAGDRLLSLHLHDNAGLTDSHLPPGEGTVDWAGLASGLAKLQYPGCLMWEVVDEKRPPAETLAATMSFYREFVTRMGVGADPASFAPHPGAARSVP